MCWCMVKGLCETYSTPIYQPKHWLSKYHQRFEHIYYYLNYILAFWWSCIILISLEKNKFWGNLTSHLKPICHMDILAVTVLNTLKLWYLKLKKDYNTPYSRSLQNVIQWGWSITLENVQHLKRYDCKMVAIICFWEEMLRSWVVSFDTML